MKHILSTPSTDASTNDKYIRLFQDMSCYDRPNRRIYVPAKDFTAICFQWLSKQGYEINYPNQQPVTKGSQQ